MDLLVAWLGRLAYRDAWRRQHELVAARSRGEGPDTLLLVEHDPVLTLGRHADPAHVLATQGELAARAIEVVPVERGGEVTYHGPGQLVAYPIVHLAQAGLLLRPFVRALESAMADTAASYGICAGRREGFPGCWIEPGRLPAGQDADRPAGPPRKLGALGLKVERGVTYHGIAFNVTTRLADFRLIDPCGIADLEVTSVARELGWSGGSAEPSTESVRVAGERFARALSGRLDEAGRLTGDDGGTRGAPEVEVARSAG